MAEFDLGKATVSDLTTIRKDFEVDAVATTGVSETDETTHDIANAATWQGYYFNIPEYKTAINAFATWIVGKGWTADNATMALLDNIRGWGEDTFQSILWNMLVNKKVVGSAFAEIIRNPETGTLLNLKPLDPGSITTVVDNKGMIKEYRQTTKTGKKSKLRVLQPNQVLHLVNDRYADNIFGTSVTEAVTWVILARNEAMRDWRRISHRSTIRVLRVDTSSSTKLDVLKRQYADAIEKGELMLIPGKPGDSGFEDLTLPPVESFLAWIRYLEDIFYKSLGVPKVILGGSGPNEGDAKVSYLTFEQVYVREVEELKADLWNQLAIRVEFPPPVSLKDKVQDNEIKNTSQVGFQTNDVQAGVGE